ncbi:MAG: transcription factor FapR [Firmicutes bacterium]|nr:transcription factor FapR [Bacillota bacterium]
MARSKAKEKRQQQLRELLDSDPFMTDEELAATLHVSVQTIRLDRMELGIPELRERTKHLAETTYARIRSVSGGEVIGELTEIELEKSGSSILLTTDDMGFKKTGIVRGHYVFAQGNSLAIALVDAPVALTAKAEVKFVRPVFVGDRVFARAVIKSARADRYEVLVESRVENQLVFVGEFTVVGLQHPPAP